VLLDRAAKAGISIALGSDGVVSCVGVKGGAASDEVRLIDLHCHMLPGIDDGAVDEADALAMARIAVEDGIQVTACTPHIYPGMYENTGPAILEAVRQFQQLLTRNDISLQLTSGADVHMTPDLVSGLKSGRILTLGGSRYFLFEPPHFVAPPRLEETVFDVMACGYHPVLTHPERLSWIESHYPIMQRMAHAGCWMQLTAGSITGRFGPRPKYWSERMLDEGLVHIVASDAHNVRKRSPQMAHARDLVAERLGEQAALDMVLTRPRAVLEDASPSALHPPVAAAKPQPKRFPSFRQLFGAQPTG
jgi:protein-tyrosine phosphatase